VRTHADSAIGQFDFDLAVRKRKAALRRESKYKKGEALVDEGRFTLVVRGGAYGQAVGGGVGVVSRKFVNEYAKGLHGKESGCKWKRYKKGKEKGSMPSRFTRSRMVRISPVITVQLALTGRNSLLELKRKWEDDKAAVEKLKASKKNKPYWSHKLCYC